MLGAEFCPLCSVTIELIQVDSSGEPLSIGETLSNLEKVTDEITKSGLFSGAELGGISAVNPSKCPSITGRTPKSAG